MRALVQHVELGSMLWQDHAPVIDLDLLYFESNEEYEGNLETD